METANSQVAIPTFTIRPQNIHLRPRSSRNHVPYHIQATSKYSDSPLQRVSSRVGAYDSNSSSRRTIRMIRIAFTLVTTATVIIGALRVL